MAGSKNTCGKQRGLHYKNHPHRNDANQIFDAEDLFFGMFWNQIDRGYGVESFKATNRCCRKE